MVQTLQKFFSRLVLSDGEGCKLQAVGLRNSRSPISYLLAPARAAALALTLALAGAAQAQVRISQVYGGGGNTGATLKNDFIELYNAGNSSVSLSGWSVQYNSATGTSAYLVTTLSGTIGAKKYYLIQQAAGSGGTANLPTPDATGTIGMSGTAFRVALVNSTSALAASSAANASGVVDFVGAGSGVLIFEGSGAAPAPSNTTAIIRKAAGETDSNNNSSDFETGTPNPRNSSSPGGGPTGPTISGFSPSSGAVGSSVTITGSNFSSPTVKFNGTTATVTASTATSITATVPSGATTGPITVEVAGQTTATSASSFTVSSASAPAISSVTPSTIYSGLGQTVTITGSNFTGATGVTFNALNAVSFNVVSDTQITATPPTAATTGTVTVTTANGTGSGNLTVTPLDSSETVLGDYSNNTNAPTALALGTTTKLVAGAVAGEADYLTFTVPAGYRLNGLNLKYFSFSTDQVAFVALDSGITWTAGQTTTDMLGYSHFGTPDLNTDLLTKMNVAGSYLPSGDYTLWVQQLGAANTYVLEFELAAAPPLTLTLNPTSAAENAGAGASTGTVGIPTALTSDLAVALASTNTAAATVPASVTITAGQTNATFAIAAVANPTVYASQSSLITASATGYANASATFTVTNVDVPPAPLAAKGWINEFHYDNSGADTGEFVEIVLAPGTATNNVSLVLYNGTGGGVYTTGSPAQSTFPLSQFTAGANTNGFSIYSVSIPGIQNGSPDGFALIIDGVPEDLVSYEGTFLATDGAASGYNLPDIGIAETGSEAVGGSLYRYGPGTTGLDFAWAKATVATPGQLNAGQELGVTGVQGTGTVALANSTSNSSLLGKNIFAKNSSNQAVSLTLTGTLTSGSISAMSVTVPSQFTGLTNTNQITVTGTGGAAASVGISGQTITVTGLAVDRVNPAILNIAGLTTPETAGSLANDGNYSFAVQTGTAGNLRSVLLPTTALVIIPIANLGDVDANGVTLDAGKTVAVQGVCTEENFNSSSSTSAYLQSGQPDGTNKAGINVYSGLRGLFVRGNEFVVAGSVLNYNGLTEVVVANANQVISLGASSNQPTPVTLTIGQLTAAHEAYEGSLVRVTGLTKVTNGGTWAFTTNTNGTIAGANITLQNGGSNLTARLNVGSTATNEPSGCCRRFAA